MSEEIEAAPFAVFCGLDVGKTEHHACALDAAGKRVHDKALPNDETALRSVFTALAEHGRVLVVVDQPASIGALAVAVSPAAWASTWPICPGWRCAASPTCIPARARPTPATRT